MNYSTAILKYPSGRFGLVGSVPAALCDDNQQSNVYDTEREVIDALIRIGITKFQLADCSWFQPTAWQLIEASDGPVEVTEEDYWEALEVLPPIYIKGVSWFAVSEAKTHNGQGYPVYYCFAKIKEKYYGALGTLKQAFETFTAFAT